MFVKLFTQILDSSIADNRKLRHFFTDILLCSDAKGFVMMTESAISRRIGTTVEEVKWGIAELMSPDPRSKTPDCEGRRLEAVEGSGYGWRIINFESYKELRSAEDMRDKTRERVRRFRDKQRETEGCNDNVTPKTDECNDNVTPCNVTVTPCNVTVTPCNAGNAIQKKKKIQRKKKEESPTAKLPHGEDFALAWTRWRTHRAEIKKPLKPTSEEAQLKKLSNFTEAKAIAIIDHTVEMGWQGLCEPDNNSNNSSNRTNGRPNRNQGTALGQPGQHKRTAPLPSFE